MRRAVRSKHREHNNTGGGKGHGKGALSGFPGQEIPSVRDSGQATFGREKKKDTRLRERRCSVTEAYIQYGIAHVILWASTSNGCNLESIVFNGDAFFNSFRAN